MASDVTKIVWNIVRLVTMQHCVCNVKMDILENRVKRVQKIMKNVKIIQDVRLAAKCVPISQYV